MDSLLSAAGGEVGTVLYGEAADTVLGPSAAVLIGNVQRKRRRLAWLPQPGQRALAALLDRSRSVPLRRLALVLRYTAEERGMRLFELESRTPLHRLLPGSPAEPPETDESIGAKGATEGAVEWFQRRTIVGDCRIHWHAVQRMAFAYGLAVDNPFIEDHVLNVGRRLPRAYKRDGDLHKPVVRALARRFTPDGYVDLPKLGFPVPARRWLEGPLKPWVDAVHRADARVWSVLDRRAFEALVWPADLEQVWTVATLERFIRLFLEPETS
jgi:asparagine synthetase B (glutamine-hydrolysing)